MIISSFCTLLCTKWILAVFRNKNWTIELLTNRSGPRFHNKAIGSFIIDVCTHYVTVEPAIYNSFQCTESAKSYPATKKLSTPTRAYNDAATFHQWILHFWNHTECYVLIDCKQTNIDPIRFDNVHESVDRQQWRVNILCKVEEPDEILMNQAEL